MTSPWTVGPDSAPVEGPVAWKHVTNQRRGRDIDIPALDWLRASNAVAAGGGTRNRSVRQSRWLVWDLPGGVLQTGESELDALTRELNEELGVQIVRDSTSRLCRLLAGPSEEPALLSAWLVHEWQGTPANVAPEEHDEIGWFTVEKLPPPGHPLLGEALVDAMLGRRG